MPSLPVLQSPIRNKRFAKSLLIVGLCFWSAGCLAEWHGSLSFLSDYVFRGYSKSRGNPVAQGHLEYQSEGGWFTGAGLSQVSFDDGGNPDRATLEARPYLGLALPISQQWRSEISLGGYLYDGQVFGHDAHYLEWYGALHYRDWMSFSLALAPDAYQRDAVVPNYEWVVRRNLLDRLQCSLGLGYHQAGRLMEQDYFFWNVGASWYFTRHLALDFRYVDASISQKKEEEEEDKGHSHEFYPRILEDKWLLSLTLGF